jgi:hypothetical protein
LFGAARITGVAFELKLSVPSAFVAMTRERIRRPRSAEVGTYIRRVSPEIVAQLTPLAPPPLASQRSHRYRNDTGGVPAQEPFVVKSVFPRTGVP